MYLGCLQQSLQPVPQARFVCHKLGSNARHHRKAASSTGATYERGSTRSVPMTGIPAWKRSHDDFVAKFESDGFDLVELALKSCS